MARSKAWVIVAGVGKRKLAAWDGKRWSSVDARVYTSLKSINQTLNVLPEGPGAWVKIMPEGKW